MKLFESALVVDDDDFVRNVVTRQLRGLGGRVVAAGDGTAALQALREGNFDLVVCDLKMPGMDGVELLRELATLQPGASLILMSSVEPALLRAAEGVAAARGLRIVGSLSKPVRTEALKALIERAASPAPRKPAGPRAPLPSVTAEALAAAIEASHIDVYVQPKVALADGSLAGAEALARWLPPQGGMIPPDAFIGAAERFGLLDALTDCVLKQSLSACAAWRAQGLVVPISINLPIESLERLQLPDTIFGDAQRHGLPPEQVVLEVTETGVMKDLARSLDVVTRMRLRGLQLSVDDFGTGWSSLEQLKRFPFTELKIDRAFVDGAARDPRLRSICESSIGLARGLGLKTVAEGVETQADWDLMRELGCDLVQGYFVARPMPKHELPAWAAARAR